MSKNLKQSERVIVGSIYFIALFLLYRNLGENFSALSTLGSDSSVWFYSGALLIILGSYITEPYFSKPTDTIASSISLLLALLGVTNKKLLIGYNFMLVYALLMLGIAVIAIFLKDQENKPKEILYFITKTIGTSKFMFSTIYILSAFSYFATGTSLVKFGIMLLLWSCLVMGDPIGWLLLNIKGIIKISKSSKSIPLGKVIQCTNTNIATIELKSAPKDSLVGKVVCIKQAKNTYVLSIIINQYYLLDRIHADTYTIMELDVKTQKELLDQIYGEFLNLDLVATARLVALDTLPENVCGIIIEKSIYKNIDRFIGTVMSDSDVSKIKIAIRGNTDNNVRDGAILQTNIYGKPVLYQLINGITKNDEVDRQSSNRYIMGIAKKLGRFEEGSLNIVPWTPNVADAVFLYKNRDVDEDTLKTLAHTTIGRLPGTALGIALKEPSTLVTHNTAILGILGIGKSCLAFELLKKLSETDVKVICIDITNQYYSENGLLQYFSETDIQHNIDDEIVSSINPQYRKTGSPDIPSAWGNEQIYIEKIKVAIGSFMGSNAHISVINPEKHNVSRAASLFRIADFHDLTVVEKTRIISESILEYCSSLGQTTSARCLIVFEEAHTLVPEWNSVSATGDQTAANGISKVIMQGRKYGLGCFVITQRTANVTKSILNQCNTIFALRMYDDTGKSFLENYIGQDYTSSISTLEERHCIAIGKALRLKQPVIIQLNDRKYFHEATASGQNAQTVLSDVESVDC